ncbi:MAG: hypothetical protein JNL50_05770 [Phycisphaerae bacterium]|nr:hypothetical protein [Phycisphaerae bacterium]
MCSQGDCDRGITAHEHERNEGWYTEGVEAKARYRAGMVVRQFGTVRGDIDDVTQAALMRVARAMQGFDPARGKPAAFIREVLDRWYQDTCRACRKARLRRAATMDSLGSGDHRVESGAPGPCEEVDRRLDTAACMAKLREADAQAARDSVTIRRNEAAKRFRKKRTAYRRHQERLRASFSDLDPKKT